MNESGVSSAHDPTLCWDCANATRPWRCKWVGEFQPVDGWAAQKNLVSRRSAPYESYHVVKCPKFSRDSYCGGLAHGEDETKAHLDHNDVASLAEAIIEQQIQDWKDLEYGALDSYAYSGNYIKKKEVVAFFHSPWCAELLAAFTQWTPAQVRGWLKIPPLKSL